MEGQGILTDKVDNMQQDIDTIKQDVADIKFELKRKVSYDEFEKLENRVARLEKVAGTK